MKTAKHLILARLKSDKKDDERELKELKRDGNYIGCIDAVVRIRYIEYLIGEIESGELGHCLVGYKEKT